jgi:tyrosyl-tRNA synthetase
MDVLTLLQSTGLIPTRSEGRRLVEQGGIRINDVQIQDILHKVTLDDFNDQGELMIKKGKKGFHRVQI